MALNPPNSSNLEQLALKGLNRGENQCISRVRVTRVRVLGFRVRIRVGVTVRRYSYGLGIGLGLRLVDFGMAGGATNGLFFSN